jgi:hypothetical protein
MRGTLEKGKRMQPIYDPIEDPVVLSWPTSAFLPQFFPESKRLWTGS